LQTIDPGDISQPVLVTGANGFIGQRLVARLLTAGLQVRVMTRSTQKSLALWGQAVEIVAADIADAAAVAGAMQGIGTVFHLAAHVSDWDPGGLKNRAIHAGSRMIFSTAAAAGARTILVSSIAVYGEASGRDICPEDHPYGRPRSPYDHSKQVQETLAWAAVKDEGLKLVVIRPAVVYGPGSKAWVDEAVKSLRAGGPLLIDGGDCNAGLVYVENVIDMLIKAAAAPAALGRTYNACDGLDVSWRRYFTDLACLAGLPPPQSMPLSVARMKAFAYEMTWRLLRMQTRPPLTRGAVDTMVANFRIPIDRARRELGYEPRVAYEEGMAAVSEYMRQTYR